jgi:hypothetical protein
MEKISYQGWQNCYRISNSVIDLVVTGDVGPRILRAGFVGQANELVEVKDQLGQTGAAEWMIYGGHRLWHAPEEKPRSYFPDNSPVTVQDMGGFVRVTQPVEATTGIQKEIDISLEPGKAHAHLVHRLINRNLWAVELAPWALSVMDAGGVAILPIPARGSHTDHLLPTNTLTMWAYTNFSDSRWVLGEHFILLRQDSQAAVPQKVGMYAPDGWIAYAHNQHLFLKKVTPQPGARYPDYGCNLETFTNEFMLEIESVGPLVLLAPGAAVEHVEDWYLFQDVPAPKTDADVSTNILPKIAGIF